MITHNNPFLTKQVFPYIIQQCQFDMLLVIFYDRLNKMCICECQIMRFAYGVITSSHAFILRHPFHIPSAGWKIRGVARSEVNLFTRSTGITVRTKRVAGEHPALNQFSRIMYRISSIYRKAHWSSSVVRAFTDIGVVKTFWKWKDYPIACNELAALRVR